MVTGFWAGALGLAATLVVAAALAVGALVGAVDAGEVQAMSRPTIPAIVAIDIGRPRVRVFIRGSPLLGLPTLGDV
jgi:hypothetical protein